MNQHCIVQWDSDSDTWEIIGSSGRVLTFANRPTYDSLREALDAARKHNFDVLNIDLLPDLEESW